MFTYNYIYLFIVLILIVVVHSQPKTNYDEFILSQVSISNKGAMDLYNQLVNDDANNQEMSEIQGTFGIVSAISNFAGAFGPVGTAVTGIVEIICAIGSSVAQSYETNESAAMFDLLNEITDFKLNKSIMVSLDQEIQNVLGLIHDLNENMAGPFYNGSATDIGIEIDTIISAFGNYNSFNEFWSLGLFTLFTDAHLQFMRNLYLNADYYMQPESKLISFYNEYTSKRDIYIHNITQTAEKGRQSYLNSASGKHPYEIFNIVNSFNEYLNSYVYDITNYWWTYDPILYPKGVIVENARVTISNINGAVYQNTDDHVSSGSLLTLLSNSDIYTYRGQLLSVSTRSDSSFYSYNFDFLKYLSSTNYVMSNQTTQTMAHGDPVFSSGEIKEDFFEYIIFNYQKNPITTNLQSTPISNVITALAVNIDGLDNKDSLFGFGFQDIDTFYGFNSTESIQYRETISYPSKVLNKVLSLAYTQTSVTEITPQEELSQQYFVRPIIQGGIFGFVGKDIIDKNIIIQGAITQVDGQKYYNAAPSSQLIYQANQITLGLGGIGIPTGNTVIYELHFESFDDTPQYFNLSLIANTQYPSATLQVSISYGNPVGCPLSLNTGFTFGAASAPSYSWKVAQGVELLSGQNNYIIIKNSGTTPFFLNSLLLADISYNLSPVTVSPYESSSSGYGGN